MEEVLHIGHSLWYAGAPMVAGAAVMYIARRAFNGVRAGTIGRSTDRRHLWVGGQPPLHGFRLLALIVI